MRKVLEVIVTSVADAKEAEAGGADRLELVRDLAHGGLTPDFELVAAVLEAVRIPVRVMLRHEPTMCAGGASGIARLKTCARRLATLPIDGMVAGFVCGGAIERHALEAIFHAAPGCRFTFHRAFEELPDALAAIAELKQFPQVDRLLTSGGLGDWKRRKTRLIECQRAADPEITVLAGAGLAAEVLAELASTPEIREVHVGRAARANHSVHGAVEQAAVRRLRNILQ